MGDPDHQRKSSIPSDPEARPEEDEEDEEDQGFELPHSRWGEEGSEPIRRLRESVDRRSYYMARRSKKAAPRSRRRRERDPDS